jgi:2-hydroxychromene-2-carboxylate isomerase
MMQVANTNTKTAERMYFFIERRVMRMRWTREFIALSFNGIIYDRINIPHPAFCVNVAINGG